MNLSLPPRFRSVSTLGACVLAISLGFLVPTQAAADPGKATATSSDDAPKKPPKKKSAQAKAAKKTAKAAQKAAPAKSEKATPAKSETKPSKATPASKSKPKATAKTKAAAKPCAIPPSTIDRNGLEAETFALVDCKGRPLPEAQARLSVLARPFGVERPAEEKDAKSPSDEGVLLDEGIVTRLFLIAHEFRGKTVSLVSGYRPGSSGSLHQNGRAIDVRVAGVEGADVSAFCRTLPDTGCGFYPNSGFVHIDVREHGTGSVWWIDAAGPGEPPLYINAWPPDEKPDASDGQVMATADTPRAPDAAKPEASADAPKPEVAAGAKSEPAKAESSKGEPPKAEAKHAKKKKKRTARASKDQPGAKTTK